MKKKVVLNMIVKNEKHILQRCLTSVKPLIDAWVIVDTGSTDGTQEMVQEFMKELPGELHERPWVNFETNRTEALELAKTKGDYILVIDADDYLETAKNFTLPALDQDGYLIHQETKEAFPRSFQYLLLIASHLPWKWVGALHEELICPEAKLFKQIQGITHYCTLDGARSRDPKKLHKDVEILERAHKEDPSNLRYPHFLGITYEAIKKPELALKYYEIRSKMGGWDEEVFYSLYKVADLQRRLGKKTELFLKSYGKAHQARPFRAEPLFWLTHYAISQENFSLGYLLSKEASSLPFPKTDSINVEGWIYEYGALLHFVKCSFQMKKYQECLDAMERLKKTPRLPPSALSSIEEVYPIVKQHVLS